MWDSLIESAFDHNIEQNLLPGAFELTTRKPVTRSIALT